MIEQTATSGYECTEEIEIEIPASIVRRSRDSTDVKSSGGTGKRRRCGGSEHEEEDVFQLQYRSRRDVDVNFRENVVSTAVSGANSSSVVYSMHGDSISDLEAVDAKFLPETVMFNSSNAGFSGETETETSTSGVICLESEEMESSAAAEKTTAIEATSRRRRVPAAEMMPSAAELEEFFSKAEKYEQKRFAEKYNFDIVKDVPMEGRYQWVPLPPLPQLPLPLKP